MSRTPWESGGPGEGSFWHRVKGLISGHEMGWYRVWFDRNRRGVIWCRGSDYRARLGLYEREVSGALVALHEQGMGCFDVGCGYGYHLLLLAGLSMRAGGADADGSRVMWAKQSLERSGFRYARAWHVRVEELPEWPSLVKIDVEGEELGILKASRRVLADRRPSLVVEVHGEALLEGCVEVLRGCGYGWLWWADAGRERFRGWLVAVGQHAGDVGEELRGSGFRLLPPAGPVLDVVRFWRGEGS